MKLLTVYYLNSRQQKRWALKKIWTILYKSMLNSTYISDSVETLIQHGFADYMVPESYLGIFLVINHGGWGFIVDISILLYINYSRNFLYVRRPLQGYQYVTTIVCLSNIFHLLIKTTRNVFLTLKVFC